MFEKLYKVSDFHLSYSDLDVEGDDYNDAHSYIMERVIEQLYMYDISSLKK